MTLSLKKKNLYRSDPIASLLVEKLNLSPLGAGLWSIAIAIILYKFVMLRHGNNVISKNCINPNLI